MNDGRHAYIRPSNAAILSRCYGYAALNAALGTEYVEEQDNEVREDGTACHWLAKEVWDGRPVEPGGLAPNGRELTEEMFAAVDEYHALLLSWVSDRARVVLEQTIKVSQAFPGMQDGTPDAWAYDPHAATLYVGDLKFGYRPVEVWRNSQLTVYAWTLIQMLCAAGYKVHNVKLYIFQPRVAHRDGYARCWSVDTQALAQLAKTIADHVLECLKPNPPCTVNPGCRNCAAAFGCRTLQAAAGSGIEISYDATPFVLTSPQVGHELAKLMAAQQRIEDRITGLTVQAESLIKRGERVPGFEMGRSATRWRWRSGADALLRRLAPLFGVEVMDEPKVKTVAKLRDKLPQAVIDMYAFKPDGELKLRLVDPNEAVRKFEK